MDARKVAHSFENAQLDHPHARFIEYSRGNNDRSRVTAFPVSGLNSSFDKSIDGAYFMSFFEDKAA